MAVPLVRREIRHRPGRFALLTATVAVAVAFTTAAFGFAEQITLQLDPDAAGSGSLALPEGTVVVTPRTSGLTTATSVDAELLGTIEQVPGVLAANGVFDQPVSFEVSPEQQPERPVQLRGLVLSSTWDPSRWSLVAGREPISPEEVAVDAGGAIVGLAPLGSTRALELPTGTRQVEVVGLVEPAGGAGIAGRGSTRQPPDLSAVALASAHVVLPAEHAADLLAAGGKVDRISVAPAPGVDPAVVAERLRDQLPPDLEVLTLTDRAQAIQTTVSGLDDGVRGAVGAFAALTVLVAALAVSNVYSVVLAQRTRELGLLRLIGAGRTQLLRVVLTEALVVGVTGAAVGIAAGSALAWAATAAVDPLGVEASLLVTGEMLLAAGLAGVAIAVLGAALPAWRAARSSPLDAISDSGAGRERSSPWWAGASLIAGAAITIAAIAVTGGFGDRPRQVLGAAAVLLGLVGVAQSSRWAVVPGAKLAAGFLVPALGVTARLGIGNVARRPARSAAAASTLMVTLALVGVVATTGASARANVDAQFRSTGSADLFVERRGLVRVDTRSLFTRMQDAFAGLDDGAEVVAVEGVLVGPAGIEQQVTTSGLGRVARVMDLDVTSGNPTAPTNDTNGAIVADPDEGPPDGVLLSEGSAEELGVALGDELTLRSASGLETPVRVVATYRNTAFVGPAVVAWPATEAVDAEGTFELAALSVADGNSTRRVDRLAQRAANDFAKVRVHTPVEFAELNTTVADTVLRIIGVLLAGAVGIGMLGLASTLALSTHERRRELVMLRAVGASRAQVRRLVGVEAATLGAFAAAIGLAAGTTAGWLAARLAPPEVAQGAVVPWATVAAVAGVAVLASWVVSRGVARSAANVAPAEAGRAG